MLSDNYLKVAIVGRPNVGKSTIFNRLSRKKLAIVGDLPGITRDRKDVHIVLNGCNIKLTDTAGLEQGKLDELGKQIREQSLRAVEQADLILLVFDARTGLLPVDEYFVGLIRKYNSKVLLIGNKSENFDKVEVNLIESLKIGLGTPLVMSAEHGIGFIELEENIAKIFDNLNMLAIPSSSQENFSREDLDKIDELKEELSDENIDPIKIAIIGRPNVGKSTLVNKLLKDDRVITGPQAGVTRDSIEVDWLWGGRLIKLVDTAGIRRKARIIDGIEGSSVKISLQSVREADVAILLMDCFDAFDQQDLSLAGMVCREGKCLVLGLNKWDRVKNQSGVMEHVRKFAHKSVYDVHRVEVVPISGLTGMGIKSVMKSVISLTNVSRSKIGTGELNRWLRRTVDSNPPPIRKGKRNKLRYAVQTGTSPLRFSIFCSRPLSTNSSYAKFLRGRMVKEYGYYGVPIRMRFVVGKNPYVSG